METSDGSVKGFGRECNSIGLCIHLNIIRVESETGLLQMVTVKKLTSD